MNKNAWLKTQKLKPCIGVTSKPALWANRFTRREKTYTEMLVPEFMQFGYPVHVIPVASGLNAIEVKDGKIYGATDRRRASSSIGEW